MALKLTKSTANETIKVICRMDDAIGEVSDEVFSEYQRTLNETLLPIVGTPTRFVLRLHLPYAAQKTVTSEQVGVGPDGSAQIKLGFMLEDVRCSLVDIENPSDLPEDSKIKFVRENDGFAGKELVAQLHSAGLVAELFAARQAALARLLPPKK